MCSAQVSRRPEAAALAPPELVADRSFLLAAASLNGLALRFLPGPCRDDDQIVLSAVFQVKRRRGAGGGARPAFFFSF